MSTSFTDISYYHHYYSLLICAGSTHLHYSGNKTLPAVKERGIKFLDVAAGTKRKQWFPSEHSKILAVYQSLVDGGVIKVPKNTFNFWRL